MPRRELRHRRNAARHRVLPRILVICGGLRTEPAYFNGLVRHLENPAVAISLKKKGVSPGQLVTAAADHRDRSPDDFDDVWCVVDVDEFDIGEAVRLAAAERINLAISNPCFELWLLLHHEDCRAHLASYDAVCARLRRHVPRYDKVELRFADYAAGVDAAVTRAKVLDPRGTNHSRNPSTSVWQLAEEIMGPR